MLTHNEEAESDTAMRMINWKDLRIGIKFCVGFGAVLALLVVVGGWSIFGISGIVGNAKEVIDGNKIDAVLAQKEVDHLNWVAKLNALLTDVTVTTLDVETDHQKCGFGKWLYGDGRKHAEAMVPELAPLLKQIEGPHQKLHDSAIAIGKLFQPADLALGNFLRDKKTDHLAWTHQVKAVFVDHGLETIKAESNHTKCSLGRWLYGPGTEALRKADSQFAGLWKQLLEPHQKLHESSVKIQDLLNAGERDKARDYYINHTQQLAKAALKKIDAIIEWHDAKVAGMTAANNAYAGQTLPALKQIQGLLADIRAKAKDNIMTDEQMLQSATSTRFGVTLFCVAAIAVGTTLAFLIARGILRPLQKSVNLAETVASGDLTSEIEVRQNDEIGALAAALNKMSANLRQMMGDMGKGVDTLTSSASQLSDISQEMASGAEQSSAKAGTVASAAEEMSATMNSVAAASEQASTNVQMVATAAEQMSATINEIAQNTEKGRTITTSAVEQAGNVSGMVKRLGVAASEVDRVTETISEISEQTNLLALNATIEAARAGEAGKGFAVVANEIKELAKQTASATMDISERISGIQSTTSDTVTEIEQILDVINQVNDIVAGIAAAIDEQAVATSEIAGNVNQAAQGIDEVNQNVAQSSTVAGAISHDITEVNLASQEMSNSSSQVHGSAASLSELSEKLNNMVSRFKI